MPIDPTIYPNLANALNRNESIEPDTPDKNDNSDPPSSTQEKTVHKANLFRKLGVLAGDIYKDEKQLAQNGPSPLIRVYTFTHDGNTIESAETPQSTPSETGESLSVPFDLSAQWINLPEFQTTNTTWLIGYDIETQSYKDSGFDLKTEKNVVPKSPHCVSHQWYFNFQGIRFGFIFQTTLRITQSDFVSFINGVVPDIKDPKILKTIKVYAHYSVYESGWMIPSPPKLKSGVKTAKDLFSNLINENNDEWYGFTTLRECEFKPTKTKTGKPSTAKAKEYVINLEFGDSRKLQAGHLETLGQTIGIPKIKLPDGVIEHMADFLVTNPRTFCEYAIIDSVITAEAHLYFFYKYKTCMLDSSKRHKAKEQMRMPGYSSQFFRELYKSRYGKTWKKYLGYVGNDMTLIHKSFVHFYHGGRNDVLTVGPQGEAHYLDLHSAYLTSVVMLPDYNFSKVRITTGRAAEQRLDELYKDGPFQVVGIESSFRFNDKGKPIFPVRIDEAESLPGVRLNFNSDGIIYPKSGKSNLTMPEYWVARHDDLLDKIIVHRVIEFEKLDTRELSSEILNLLILRKDSNESDKLFYKNILNFFYGKTAQGVKKSATALKKHNIDIHVNVSSMTCYPLASYITGFCRATVGELLQHNDCYGITTDGFITPVSREKLVIHDGDLCDQVQKELIKGGFNKDFIGCDASGSSSLFLKTRGYLLIGRKPLKEDNEFVGPPTFKDFNKKLAEIGPPTRSDMLQKMAAMGVQVNRGKYSDPIGDFLKALQKGYADKEYSLKLKKVREAQKLADMLNQSISTKTVPSKQIMPNVKADMSFDMKHLPITPTTEPFEWDGKPYQFALFETEPLDTAMDFHILRALRGRNHRRDIPKSLLTPAFSYIDPAADINPNNLDAAYYFSGWQCAEDIVKHLKSAGSTPPSDITAYLDSFKNVMPLSVQQGLSGTLSERQRTDAFTSGFDGAWNELHEKEEEKQKSKKPVKKAVAQSATTAKKAKTMKIDGVEREQFIGFDSKHAIPTIIELLLTSKAIPTYMEEPDYLRMLDRYEEFRHGTQDFNDLNAATIDYDDLLNEPDNFADDTEFDDGFSNEE